MKKIDFGCSLYIYTNDDEPVSITKITGVNHTKLTIKGTPWLHSVTNKPIPNKIYKRNLWILESPREINVSEWELAKSIQYILSVLDKQQAVFKELFEKYTESYLLIFLYIEDYHINFSISPDVIDRLNDYGLRVEFDFYSLEVSDEGEK